MSGDVANKRLTISQKIQRLSPAARRKVEEYVNSLLVRRTKRGGFQFTWEGALAHLARKHTSVDLQHRASRLWGS